MEDEKQNLTKQEKSVSFSDKLSSDEDDNEEYDEEKGNNSPKVIYSGRNYERECCVSVVIIFLLLLFMIVFKMLFSDSQTEDVSGTNKLSAKLYSHNNHHIHRCDDRGFDCCYIYTKEKHIQIDPRYIVETDSVGSNCPSLTKLVNGYNHYLNEYDNNVNCTRVTCCEIDNSEEIKERYGSDAHEMLEVELESKSEHGRSTCPKVNELISKYIHNYPSPYEDLYLLAILGAVLCCIGIGSKN